MTHDDNLLSQLRDLEVALHQPEVRSGARRLGELLHDSFAEVGRSGRSYSKADVLKELALEQFSGEVWSQDFSVTEITDGVALLTYKSAYLSSQGWRDVPSHPEILPVATHGEWVANAISPGNAHGGIREERRPMSYD